MNKKFLKILACFLIFTFDKAMAMKNSPVKPSIRRRYQLKNKDRLKTDLQQNTNKIIKNTKDLRLNDTLDFQKTEMVHNSVEHREFNAEDQLNSRASQELEKEIISSVSSITRNCVPKFTTGESEKIGKKIYSLLKKMYLDDKLYDINDNDVANKVMKKLYSGGYRIANSVFSHGEIAYCDDGQICVSRYEEEYREKFKLIINSCFKPLFSDEDKRVRTVSAFDNTFHNLLTIKVYDKDNCEYEVGNLKIRFFGDEVLSMKMEEYPNPGEDDYSHYWAEFRFPESPGYATIGKV